MIAPQTMSHAHRASNRARWVLAVLVLVAFQVVSVLIFE